MATEDSEKIEMSSQICLKWNSFLNNIATSFESLWEEEGLVDVTLASDGQCLTAHKVILSASSPFFKKVFQTNPCQHPVIILQDVHFSELEALLIFIYKGEVNIEQKNLAALLKAAETLQIRGLSGGDIFAKESYKRLIEIERGVQLKDSSASSQEVEEIPKKKQKTLKSPNNSILEKALTPRVSRSASVSESTTSETYSKDPDSPEVDSLPNPVYHTLEMKLEPFEVTVDDLQKQRIKEELERLDTGQEDATQVDRKIAASSTAYLKVIAEARDICHPNERSLIHDFQNVDSKNIEQSKETSPSTLVSQISQNETKEDSPEISLNSDQVSPSNFDDPENLANPEHEFNGQTTTTKDTIVYPPFPCPFCDRAYASWGFRRRHIKAVHTMSPQLNCKWCSQVLPTHAAWRRHVIACHNLSASDAHNGLLILEEAHMVLQIARPTRLDTLVNIIKQNNQQNNHDNPRHNSEPNSDQPSTS